MYDLLKALSLPPANLVVLVLFGLWLRRRAMRAGTVIAVMAAATLYLLSTSFVASRLMLALEAGNAVPQGMETKSVQAIVILSAGYSYFGVRGTRAGVDVMTLERLRTGAQLHRETGLPILVTGGGEKDDRQPVGTLMGGVLRTDFGIEPKWVEDMSSTTYENAKFSRQMLREHGISRIYLVSQGWHLPRARAAFEAMGFSVVPVPSSTSRPTRVKIHAFVPSAKALQASHYTFHELLGLIWYRWGLFGRA